MIDVLGQALASNLLVVCTCGLAAPWVIAWNLAVRARNSSTSDGRRLEFFGSGMEVFGLWILSVVGMVLSLGAAWPLLAMMWKTWEVGNTAIVDPGAPGGHCRLRLDAGPLAFLVQGMLSYLRVVVTFGLCRSTALLNFERFVWSSTSDELSLALMVSAGPRTPGQWAAVASVFATGVGLALLVFTLAAGASRGRHGLPFGSVSDNRGSTEASQLDPTHGTSAGVGHASPCALQAAVSRISTPPMSPVQRHRSKRFRPLAPNGTHTSAPRHAPLRARRSAVTPT